MYVCMVPLLQSQHHWNGSITNTHSVDAHVDQLQEMFSGADVPAALDFAAVFHLIHDDLNYFRRRTFQFMAGQKTSGGLHKVNSGGNAALTALPDLLFT